jgi:predicted Rossmann fold flavoprotein
MAAAHSGPNTLVVDHAKAAGEKIRISGGGRCNFTNMYCAPERFLGENPHFHKSALSRYTQWDFLDLVMRHKIAYHEKTLGQLFCDDSARQIVRMLLDEAEAAGATVWLNTEIRDLSHDGAHYKVTLEQQGKTRTVTAKHVIVATGGKSIPKMGATGIAYDIAKQFGHSLTETRPGLVPFTFPDGRFKPLAGVAVPSRISCNGATFDEALLFTHRGLSGPAILQVSSYWQEGQEISVNLIPEADLAEHLRAQRTVQGKRNLSTELASLLPGRLVDFLKPIIDFTGNLGDLSDKRIDALVDQLRNWQLTPQGTEGYRTAEVTLGGVSTAKVSSKTMESQLQPNLFFIGEALDVTGWLGGYNFQWAWSSAVAAGQAIRERG